MEAESGPKVSGFNMGLSTFARVDEPGDGRSNRSERVEHLVFLTVEN
jgi:hypothetical protein